MTHDRLIARFRKGAGWSYNVGGILYLSPRQAQDLLVDQYGLDFRTAREKLQAARAGRIITLDHHRDRPVRQEVNA